MTRKRYIKLLMGRQGYSRNEAREDAKIFMNYHETMAKFHRQAVGYHTRYRLRFCKDEILMRLAQIMEILANEEEKIHQTADGEIPLSPK